MGGGFVSRSNGAVGKRILMLAWLADPERGSEWAAGWGMAYAAAALGRVTLLVRPDCVAPIRAWCAEHPATAIEPVAVEPPAGARPSLARLLPKGHFLDYLAWLEAAGEVARGLVARERFDLAVHAALGCYWLPSPVIGLGIPSVWGPVGGATRPPPALLPLLGLGGLVARAGERLAHAVGARLPATRATMHGADRVLVECRSTLAVLPAAVAARARVLNRAVLTRLPALPAAPARPRGRFVLFPSTLHAHKGPDLALDALRTLPEGVELWIANDGPEEARLRRRAAEPGLEGRVRFLGRVPRGRCFELMREAGAVLFAGIHEDGGCALCEAMLLGAPVAVLAHGGPREIVERWGTDRARVRLVPPAGPAETARALGQALGELLARPATANGPLLDQAGATLAFLAELEEAMAVAARAPRARPDRALPQQPAEPALPAL